MERRIKSVTTDYKIKVQNSVCSFLSTADCFSLYTTLVCSVSYCCVLLRQVKNMGAAQADELTETTKTHNAEIQDLSDQHVLQQCELLRKLMLITQEQQTQQLTYLHER